MADNKKYIGEGKLPQEPNKKLTLKLKDGSVTTNKIADGAVTGVKLGTDVKNTLNNIQGGMVRGISINGGNPKFPQRQGIINLVLDTGGGNVDETLISQIQKNSEDISDIFNLIDGVATNGDSKVKFIDYWQVETPPTYPEGSLWYKTIDTSEGATGVNLYVSIPSVVGQSSMLEWVRADSLEDMEKYINFGTIYVSRTDNKLYKVSDDANGMEPLSDKSVTGLDVSYNEEKLNIRIEYKDNSYSEALEIPCATEEHNGLMSAEDKIALNDVNNLTGKIIYLDYWTEGGLPAGNRLPDTEYWWFNNYVKNLFRIYNGRTFRIVEGLYLMKRRDNGMLYLFDATDSVYSELSFGSVNVDSSFVYDSTNPVESRVIKEALDTKADKLQVGDVVTIAGWDRIPEDYDVGTYRRSGELLYYYDGTGWTIELSPKLVQYDNDFYFYTNTKGFKKVTDSDSSAVVKHIKYWQTESDESNAADGDLWLTTEDEVKIFKDGEFQLLVPQGNTLLVEHNGEVYAVMQGENTAKIEHDLQEVGMFNNGYMAIWQYRNLVDAFSLRGQAIPVTYWMPEEAPQENLRGIYWLDDTLILYMSTGNPNYPWDEFAGASADNKLLVFNINDSKLYVLGYGEELIPIGSNGGGGDTTITTKKVNYLVEQVQGYPANVTPPSLTVEPVSPTMFQVYKDISDVEDEKLRRCIQVGEPSQVHISLRYRANGDGNNVIDRTSLIDYTGYANGNSFVIPFSQYEQLSLDAIVNGVSTPRSWAGESLETLSGWLGQALDMAGYIRKSNPEDLWDEDNLVKGAYFFDYEEMAFIINTKRACEIRPYQDVEYKDSRVIPFFYDTNQGYQSSFDDDMAFGHGAYVADQEESGSYRKALYVSKSALQIEVAWFIPGKFDIWETIGNETLEHRVAMLEARYLESSASESSTSMDSTLTSVKTAVATVNTLASDISAMKNNIATQTYYSTPKNAAPVNPTVGMCYFNTTIGKPCWWNGTNWVDASGNTIN